MTPLTAVTLAPALEGGAAIGSFISVVAARVPPLRLASADGRVRMKPLFSTLSWPASHCTHCDAPLRWRDNVPLLSYLALKGRCRNCRSAFGGKYLLLELGGALAGAASVHLFGWSAQGGLCFLFLCLLLVLSAIDLAEMLLPDVLVFPLLPAGLVWQSLYGRGLAGGVLGAIAGFAVLWAIGAGYRLIRRQDGMGGGDMKLAGALGAWLGIAAMPFFFAGAFACGLVVMTAWLHISKSGSQRPLPFGPFLALSGVLFVVLPQATDILAGMIAV